MQEKSRFLGGTIHFFAFLEYNHRSAVQRVKKPPRRFHKKAGGRMRTAFLHETCDFRGTCPRNALANVPILWAERRPNFHESQKI